MFLALGLGRQTLMVTSRLRKKEKRKQENINHALIPIVRNLIGVEQIKGGNKEERVLDHPTTL